MVGIIWLERFNKYEELDLGIKDEGRVRINYNFKLLREKWKLGEILFLMVEIGWLILWDLCLGRNDCWVW